VWILDLHTAGHCDGRAWHKLAQTAGVNVGIAGFYVESEQLLAPLADFGRVSRNGSQFELESVWLKPGAQVCLRLVGQATGVNVPLGELLNLAGRSTQLLEKGMAGKFNIKINILYINNIY
jgi:hypothetical protein